MSKQRPCKLVTKILILITLVPTFHLDLRMQKYMQTSTMYENINSLLVKMISDVENNFKQK